MWTLESMSHPLVLGISSSVSLYAALKPKQSSLPSPLLDVSASPCHVVYVNHRPAFGLSQHELIGAIRTLGLRTEGREWAISRSHLLSILQECGECASACATSVAMVQALTNCYDF